MTSTHAVTKILKTDTQGRIRTPAQDREALLALYDQGAMSGAAFARTYGLRYSTFMGWIRKRRLRSPADPPVSLFREVVVAPSSPTGLMVELPLGVRVRLEHADQIPVIAALSRQLHEASGC
ncbi:MAG TPA: hypothetical protein PKE26_16700 [Kiritimatiellia bacterium]|nr:hypothetical protein [Kiritimatiellia bacterium]HMP00737.1 hypothetical protein [Kiritimatiellia bacterium]